MKLDHSLDRLASTQMGRRDLEQRAFDESSRSPSGGPVLTISRDYYCGGEAVAKDLARRLSWRIYDREIVDGIAADRRVDPWAIAPLDERAFDFVQEWCNEVFLPGYTGQATFMRGLVHVILRIVREGNAIVMGRGANFLIPGTKRLAVRLTAPFPWRVGNYARLSCADERMARRAVEQEDLRRADFVRRNFHRDPSDPLHYDMVINMEANASDAVPRLILEGLATRFGAKVATARV